MSLLSTKQQKNTQKSFKYHCKITKNLAVKVTSCFRWFRHDTFGAWCNFAWFLHVKNFMLQHVFHHILVVILVLYFQCLCPGFKVLFNYLFQYFFQHESYHFLKVIVTNHTSIKNTFPTIIHELHEWTNLLCGRWFQSMMTWYHQINSMTNIESRYFLVMQNFVNMSFMYHTKSIPRFGVSRGNSCMSFIASYIAIFCSNHVWLCQMHLNIKYTEK